MPWKHEWIPPEEAFEVRIQCTEKQIHRHCDAAPENDRRDFDDQGGLQVPVYHVYKDNRDEYALAYWYTFDESEDKENEFDIRDLPNFSTATPHSRDYPSTLQDALDKNLCTLIGNRLHINKEPNVSHDH